MIGLETLPVHRTIGKLTASIQELPRPTLWEVRQRFPDHKIEYIDLDTSPVLPIGIEIDSLYVPSEKDFASSGGCRGKTRKEYGADYKRRVRSTKPLGLQHALWIYDHQFDYRLWELCYHLGRIKIDFPGMLVTTSYGSQACFRLSTSKPANHFEEGKLIISLSDIDEIHSPATYIAYAGY